MAIASPTWQTIIALARYGGLRTPSETLSLPWRNVDWAAERLTIVSPKTAHHPGKGNREIPIFTRLRPYLDKAFELAPDGAEYVVDGNHREASNTASGWRNCNLRTEMGRLIKRAGLEQWPRMFHALRSSCETDLAAEFPLHVVTGWLGNTPKVALKHYLMATEADFQRAAKSAAESGAVNARNRLNQEENPADPTEETAGNTGSCTLLPLTACGLNGEDRIRTCGRV